MNGWMNERMMLASFLGIILTINSEKRIPNSIIVNSFHFLHLFFFRICFSLSHAPSQVFHPAELYKGEHFL